MAILTESKDFRNELELLLNELTSGKKLSFSKYADGEYAILSGRNPINNKEFEYKPTLEYSEARQKLIDSFFYLDDGYYIGISCPCCDHVASMNMRRMLWMNGRSYKDTTYANIFVNSNYTYYKNYFIPLYKERKVFLVANRNGKISNLPFRISGCVGVGDSAYLNYQEYTDTMLDLTKEGDWLVLFACGPLGNILAYEGWKNNKNNTYLDIGSTLNPWLQSEGFKRHYYEGENHYSRQVCRW